MIMKALAISLFMLLCGFAQAQTNKSKKTQDVDRTSSYCMEVKGDNLVLTKDGRQLYEDVKLEDGTRITTNGRIIRTDGTEKLLHEKECADLNGEIMKPIVENR